MKNETKVVEVQYRRGLRRPRPEGATVGEVPVGFEIDPGEVGATVGEREPSWSRIR